MDLNYAVPGELTRGSRAHHLMIPPSKLSKWLIESIDHTPTGLLVVPHIILAMAGNRYPDSWYDYLDVMGLCSSVSYPKGIEADFWCVRKHPHDYEECSFYSVIMVKMRIEGTVQVHPQITKFLKEQEKSDPCTILLDGGTS